MYSSLQSHWHIYRFIYTSIITSLIKLHLNWWWTENIFVVSSPSSMPHSCSSDIYIVVELRSHLELGRRVETEVCTGCEKGAFLYWGFQHSQILNIWRDLGYNSPWLHRISTIYQSSDVQRAVRSGTMMFYDGGLRVGTETLMYWQLFKKWGWKTSYSTSTCLVTEVPVSSLPERSSSPL